MKTVLIKTLRFTVAATLCWGFLFAGIGCDKHENPENPDEDELSLYVKVENAAKYSNIVAVKLMMRDRIIFENVELARGDWKDGGFTIVLPKIDRNKYREFIHFSFLPKSIIEYYPTITVSSKNAKLGIAEFWGVDKDDNVVTRFFPHKNEENGNAARIAFYYVSSDVSISGYIEAGIFVDEFDEYLNADTDWFWKNHTIYAVECKEGWNALSSSSFQSSSDGTITDKYSTTPMSNLKWYGGESWWELDIN